MDEKEKLEVHFKHPPQIKDLKVVVNKLKDIVGKENVSTDYIDRVIYGKDYWLISNQMTLKGKIPALPDIIVWPKTAEQISKMIKFANIHSPTIPLIPFGEGSGVVGGTVPINGGIMVDMKYFDQIEINKTNMTATIGTGVNGKTLVRYLNQHGLRMGHIPQSLHASTVGGYFAHRAAGQFSGKYGKFEDICKSMTMVLPDGEIMTTKAYPRAAVGPMVDRLFLGSEGTLGIATEVVCRIWPYPETQQGSSFVFDTLQQCLDAIRETLQSDINPAVIRIYDKIETTRHFGETEKRSKDKLMVIFISEGITDLVELELKIVKQNCKKYKGIECGDEPIKHWFKTRFTVKEASDFAPYGMVMDTIEVSIPWDKADLLYQKVVKDILQVPGAILASGHASHFYPMGVCFYFTFAATPREGTAELSLYNACWDAASCAVLNLGGAVSHHHGLGLNRTRWMKLEHGTEFKLLTKIKQLLDPKNVMNPGKLYTDSEEHLPFSKQRESLEKKELRRD